MRSHALSGLSIFCAVLSTSFSAHASHAVVEKPALKACITRASALYDLPAGLLWLILDVEGGREGTSIANTNGTNDLGPMQVNTLWLPQLSAYYGESESVVRERLTSDGCFNIAIGAWILRRNIDDAKGNMWLGVAWYHSRSPVIAQAYLSRVSRALERWYGKSIEITVDLTSKSQN